MQNPSTPGRPPHGDGLGRRTLGGLFWVLSGAGLQAVLRIALMVVLARLLAPADFGVAAAATVVVQLSLVLSQLGLAHALVQRHDLEERHVTTAFTLSLLSGLALSGLIVMLAPLVGAFFGFSDLVNVVRTLALVILIGNVGLVAEALLRRSLQFRKVATASLISYALAFGVAGLTLAVLGFGVWALVIAQLMQSFIRTILMLILQPHPKHLGLERRALGDLLYFGGGLTAWRVCHAAAEEVDSIVVGRLMGAEALGIWSRAYHLMSLPMALIGHNMVIVLVPTMAKLQHQKERFAAAFRRGLGAIALITLPTLVAFVLLAPELVAVLLGPQWPEVVLPLQIMAPGILCQLGVRLADAAATALGAVYQAAWRQALFGLTVLVGAIIGQSWGLPGVAVAVLFALFLNFTLMTSLVLRLIGVSWREVLVAHRPGAMLAAVLGAEVWLLVEVGRMLELPPLATLVFGAMIIGATLIVIIRATRVAVLGPDGAWLLGLVLDRLPARLGMVRGLLGAQALRQN